MVDDAPEAEIEVLEALAAQGEMLWSGITAGVTAFRAPFLSVDAPRRFIVIGCSDDETANTDLFSRSAVDLLAEWGEWRIAFVATGPEPCRHDARPAIRLQFPESVTISRRRMHERAAVPEHAPLRCVAYSGASFILDAAISDVSKGGLGLQMDSTGGALEPGMIIAGCRFSSLSPAAMGLVSELVRENPAGT